MRTQHAALLAKHGGSQADQDRHITYVPVHHHQHHHHHHYHHHYLETNLLAPRISSERLGERTERSLHPAPSFIQPPPSPASTHPPTSPTPNLETEMAPSLPLPSETERQGDFPQMSQIRSEISTSLSPYRAKLSPEVNT
ncbi:hypothetical protein O3P69_010784 [Scylla paramamosain]|uniref:Uncharacterized protein n=1 Tax=Scylla paramamosain TaxID=85552 RepID=A0AAW0TGV8_SCYPA